MILLGLAEAMKLNFKDVRIAMIAAKFPREFGLRGHAGTFRISTSDSYISGGTFQSGGLVGGTVMLYTEKLRGEQWVAFAKGTEAELTVQALT